MIDALCAWITATLGYVATVHGRPRSPSAAAPREPYALAWVASTRALGRIHRTHTGDCVQSARVVHTVLVDLFGDSAQNDAVTLRAASQRIEALRAMSPATISDARVTLHPSAARRATVTLTIHACDEARTPAPSIGELDVSIV